MSNWDTYKDKMPPAGSGDILKLEDGKAVKLRVFGEPFVYQSEYKGNLSTRFALRVYNQGTESAQILMIPKTAFGMIMDLATNEEWGDPEQYDISITRTGEGRDTEYSVVPSPNKKELPKEAKEALESIDLGVVLKKLPSVSIAIPLSEADPDFYGSLGTQPKQTKDTVVEVDGEEMPLDGIPF